MINKLEVGVKVGNSLIKAWAARTCGLRRSDESQPPV